MSSIPSPEPGLVIHYRFLWDHEHARGLEEGRYARPSCIVLAVQATEARTRVLVLPLTSKDPDVGAEVVELPPATRRRLGLDAPRSWIVLDQANEFDWPGFDLEQHQGGAFVYGPLPPALLDLVRRRVAALVRERRFRRLQR